MADSDNRDFQAKVTVDAKDAIDTLKDVEKAANGVTDALDKTNKTVKKTNASLDGINDTSEEFSSIGEDLKSFQDSFQKIGSEISSELKSINTELKSFKQSFADFANSAKQPLQEVAKSEGEVAEQSGKTSEQTAELTDQMSRLDSVVADFRDKLDKSTEAFGKYAVQSGSANRNTEKLIDTVRVAQSDIADAYYSMYTQLSDIAGADWDTKDVFKNLVAQTQDAKVEFGKLYIYYDNLLEHLRNGGDGATLESLKQIKQDTRDVGDATKTAGQDTREGLDDIKDGVEQFSDDVSKYWNTMSDSENQQNQEMKKLWQESSHLFDSITWSKVTQEANNYNDSLSDSVHRSEALKSMMDAISAEPGAETDYAYDLQKQLEKDLTSLSKYYNKEQELAQSNNIKENAKQWLDVEKNIETVEADIQRILGEMDTVVENGGTLAFNIDESSISQIAQYLELDNQHMEHLSYQTSTVNSDFAQLALELKRLISDTNSFYKGWESTGTYWTGELSDIEARFINVKNAISQLAMTEIPTDEYTQLGNEIEKLEGKLEMLKKVQSSVANNPDMDSRVQYKYWDALQKMINETVTELLTAKDRMSDMENNGNAYQVAVDYNDIKKMNSELDESKKKLDEVSGSGSSMFGSLSSLLGGIGGAVFSVVSAIGSGIGSIFSKLGSIAKSILKELVSLATSVAKSIWNAFKKVVSIIADATKNLVSMVSKPILNGVKSLAKWIGEAGLSLAGFSVEAINGEGLIKKLTNAVDEFMGFFKRQTIRSAVRYILNDIETVLVNIAKIDDEFNESMSNLIDSAKALGAQIVAIIEPIVDAVGPYLVQIMDWLTGVADAAAQFVARITGHDTYVKASKGQSDYASSLDDTTKSTEKATKATQEYQNTVLAFDQLNKLDNVTTVEDDDESIIGVSDADVKKAQTQATAINDLADDIYHAFEDRDWYGVGKNAAKAVDAFFSKLDEWLGWDYGNNADKFSAWIQGVIDVVNGFVDEFNWEHAGYVIGDMLNTVINLFGKITDPETGINFRKLGQGLGTLLSQAIATIDWKQLGKDIIQGMQAAVNFVVGILDEKVGKKLGEGLADCISGIADGIDPEVWSDLIVGLFENFFDFFIELFSNPEDFAKLGYKIGAGLADAIKRIDLSKVYVAMDNFWASLTAALSNFEEGFANYYDLEDGESVWTAIGEGLMIGLQGIMQWLTENVLNGKTGKAIGEGIADFISGAVNAFDAETWANFFTGIGDLLGELLAAVFSDTETWKEFGTKLGETIVAALSGGTDDATEDVEHNGIGDGIHALWEAFIAALTGIDTSGAFEAIGDSLHELITGIKSALNDPTFQKELAEIKGILEDLIRVIFEIPPEESISQYFSDMIGDMLADALVAAITHLPDAIARAIGKGSNTLVGSIFQAIVEAMTGEDLSDAMNPFAQNDNFFEIFETFGRLWQEYESGEYESMSEMFDAATISQMVRDACKDLVDSDYQFCGTALKTTEDFIAALEAMGLDIDAQSEDTMNLLTQAFEAIGEAGYVEFNAATGEIAWTIEGSSGACHMSLQEFAESLGADCSGITESINESSKEMLHTLHENAEEIKTSDEWLQALEDLGYDTSEHTDELVAMFDDLSSKGTVAIDRNTGQLIKTIDGTLGVVSSSIDGACIIYGIELEKLGDESNETTEKVTGQIGDDGEKLTSQLETNSNMLKTAIHSNDIFGSNVLHNAWTTDKASIDSDYAMAQNAFLNNGANLQAVIGSTSSKVQFLTYSASDENCKAYQTYFDEGESELGIGWNDIGDALQAGADIFNNNTAVFDAIKNFFEKLVNKISPVFTWISDAISKFFGTNTLSVSGGALTYSVPKLASGGRLDDGQLFIANENGAEMIGRYGSSTGVMNNEQIVQAVTDGVRTAVTEAWNNSNQDSGDIVLYIDSEEIARASTKGNRSIQKRTNPVVSFA